MIFPKTLQEVQNLITTQVMENIHLDYKESRALNGKPGDIAKDISAFANSDGGVIIYGVREDQHLPVDIDDGTDHTVKTREWLENVIVSNITPLLDNLRIIQIPVSTEKSIFVVSVDQSFRAPHQERQSKRYYKRYNFSSVPMEDYEIRDIQNRKSFYNPILNIDIELSQGYSFELLIENVGKVPALDITFNFPDNILWESGEPPLQLSKGIKSLQPGKKLTFFYCESHSAFSEESTILKIFTIDASYFNPEAGKRITDTFYLDIENLINTTINYSESHYLRSDIKDGFGKIVSELQKINSNLETTKQIAGPTGLNLSATSIRNLARSFGNEPSLEPYSLQSCSRNQLEEILGIDKKTAHSLYKFLRYNQGGEIEDVDGIDDEILNKFKKYFHSLK